MHKIVFIQENLKKILGFTSKFRQDWVTLNTGIFYFAQCIILDSNYLMTLNFL